MLTMPEEWSIPISALQHFVFCRRKFALIHTERLWQENALTSLGKLEHARVESARSSVRGRLREERSVQSVRRQTSPVELLGAEGYAAERYFSVFPQMIIPAEFTFAGRVKRPPRDPVNALLSFTYSLLAVDCKSALESVGLDSAVGVYHKDRPGRPGLALDLMEEFCAPLADRLVLSLLNRRQVKVSDFHVEPTGAVYLTDAARRVLLTSWQERKMEQIMHPFLQEKITIGLLPHIQAHLLAQHIRGSLDAYPPMVWK